MYSIYVCPFWRGIERNRREYSVKHERHPRRYIGLRPRKVHPPVDGAPILGPGGLTSQSLQPEGSCNPLLGNAPGTFS